MKASTFITYLKQLSELTPSQQEQLIAMLHNNPNAVVEFITENHSPICPHCQHDTLRPWGSSNGLPRFRCSSCFKTSNPLTGTPLARLRHKECWLAYAQQIIQGASVRAAAKECGVSKNTSFLWRHRFVSLAAMHKSSNEQGIVEADETYFLQSFKGKRGLERKPRRRGGVSKTRGAGGDDHVPVLVVRDRSGHTADFILKKADAKHIGAKLKPLISKDVCLCTDGANAYKTVAREAGIEHHAVIAKRCHADGPYHIQNVNAYDSRLKGWMARFHGVATKYLENYLGWHRMLDRYRDLIEPKQCLSEAIGWAQQLTKT